MLGVLLNETVEVGARNFLKKKSVLSEFQVVTVPALHWYFALVHNELLTEETLCSSAFVLRLAKAKFHK